MNKESEKKFLLSEQKRPKTNSRAKILRNSLALKGLRQKFLGRDPFVGKRLSLRHLRNTGGPAES